MKPPLSRLICAVLACTLAWVSASALAQEPADPPQDGVSVGQGGEPPVQEPVGDAGTATPQPASVQGAQKAQDERGGEQPWYERAVEQDREWKATKERWEANYRRNIYALQVAFGREILPDITEGYSGRVEFAMLLPSQDGPSSLMAIAVGASGWGSKDSWGFGLPMGFGWGYRTPGFVFYLGPLVGIGVDKGTEPAAMSVGGFGDIGVDVGGFRLMFDTRAEYRIMKYGDSRWHLTYGGLASVDL